jgi:uncharacterized protein YjbI with pentapeptide repeats
LQGADLCNADLSCANLSNADLSGANLQKANLTKAQLSGSNLFRSQNVDLSEAYLDSSTIYPDGHRLDNLLSGED